MKKRKLKILVFKSHAEQEKADMIYWQKMSPGKRVETLEYMRLNYLRMKYGRVPRLRRVYKLIKQT